MPTQSTTYNTRLTDESLERRFRETFKSQSGAELVDDLYASGVIVPVVDFTAAAEGSGLREDLQKAWDSSTNTAIIENTSTTIANTAGFWQVDLVWINRDTAGSATASIYIDQGLSTTSVWSANVPSSGAAGAHTVLEDRFIVFLQSGHDLVGETNTAQTKLTVWTRQIADLYGNLTNPSGYTSS